MLAGWLAEQLKESITNQKYSDRFAWLQGTSFEQWLKAQCGPLADLRAEDVGNLPVHLYVTQYARVTLEDTTLSAAVAGWPGLDLGSTGTFLSLAELDVRFEGVFETLGEAFEELYSEPGVAKAVRVLAEEGAGTSGRTRWFWLMGGMFHS